ncbi:hypothetical protein GC176_12335 [bacterium]|nr:hypothetical protein [bacterium]
MGIVIGMDEAGYGPNLGPLVITAAVWQMPGDPRDFDFWSSLGEVVSQPRPKRGDERLHVADSKQVHSPTRGLRDLERSIRPLMSLVNAPLASFQSLAHWLIGLDASDLLTSPLALHNEPWFADGDLGLPTSVADDETATTRKRLADIASSADLQFVTARSEIVLTQRFNQLTEQYDSKGVALSKTTLGLLGRVWDPDSDEPTLIIGDKHGGRNRYDDLIDERLDGQMIFRLRESREKSSYRVGTSELHFQTGAESHFPVAVASMICKYVRELAMEQFNTFWQQHVPGLKPTKGYPTDAKRFRADIAAAQQRLGIPDEVLWRSR